MKIAGIDPGVTIGFAVYDSAKKTIITKFDTKSPTNIINTLRALFADGNLDHVVIEDFIGNGPRDPHIIHTIKVLGYFIYTLEYFHIPYTIQVPQYRRAFISKATAACGGPGRHHVDATAHILAYIFHHGGEV